jgi:hypothetical protein
MITLGWKCIAGAWIGMGTAFLRSLPCFLYWDHLGHGLRGVALRLRSLIGFCEVEVPLACLESSHPSATCFSLLYTYVLA